MVKIRTDRLLLRPATFGDVEAFHGIMSDGRAMAYWSTTPHKDMDETRSWIASMIGIGPGEGEDFVIELDGRVIGKAGLYRFPEIGFILHPHAWGNGYAREALEAVVHAYHDFAFAEPRLYDAMFTLASNLPFGQPEAPAPLHDAFAALRDAVTPLAGDRDPNVLAELTWSALHGLVALGRAGRLRAAYLPARLTMLVDQLACSCRQQPDDDHRVDRIKPETR